MSDNQKCDVTIIGGGLAGLTLSCLLGQAGINVICADRVPDGQTHNADERTTAMSYGSQKILEKIGVWGVLKPHACPIRDIHVLDEQDSPLLLQMLSDEMDGKSFGWVIENARLRDALNNCVQSLKTVEHKKGASAQNFQTDDKCSSVTFSDGCVITSQLIIGADGRASSVRDFLVEHYNIEVRTKDYKQRAIISIINHEHPHENKAVEHFYEQGPFAVLPMVDDESGKHRSAVVLTEHGRASLMDLSAEEFTSVLQGYMPESYGEIVLRQDRTYYPLSLVHASDYIGPRIALIADAAHGIHPVAGQGLNLGFRDVKELSDLLIAAHQNGDDLGSTDLLETYQRRRRPDNLATVAVMDGLVKLFGSKSISARLMRKVGLKAVSKIPAAKRFVMRHAMADRELMKK